MGVLVNYWKCEYQDCGDEEDENGDLYYIYACNHPRNKENYCHLDNKWRGKNASCRFLKEKDSGSKIHSKPTS